MVKELRPNRETWLSTISFSPGCEARLNEHSAATSGVPSFHPPCVIVVRDAGRRQQPVARLVAPAEIGRVVDDAGGVAVAPFDGHLVTATQRHGAASGEAAAMAARVLDKASPSGSARAATRALATASAAARGVMRRASAGSITSAVMRR